ncbi:ImuA family protein [Kordiimonas laminariae]|uniref:ImuA family protein n=1 Tax=Kordiimonas laminariae TaxID=2917717 RepID=UPI001FF3D019|nr:hypothetical protein [Kordiimonas laminariae]MCK0069475.1 hypothetical protein [Kordiimonas laminariae]
MKERTVFIAHNDNTYEEHQTGSASSNNKIEALKKLRHMVAKIEEEGKTPTWDMETENTLVHATSTLDFGELRQSGVHEIWAQKPIDTAAAMALLLSIEKENTAPVLWVTTRRFSYDYGVPYGPGLHAQGITPERLLFVMCRDEKEALWAIEEGLKVNAISAVVGEVTQMDLTSSRRLTITAQDHNTRCLLLMRSEHAPSSAAYTRWQTEAGESHHSFFNEQAPGHAVLSAALTKHRGGKRPITQTMEWFHAPDYLYMASPVADRPVASITPIAQAAI